MKDDSVSSTAKIGSAVFYGKLNSYRAALKIRIQRSPQSWSQLWTNQSWQATSFPLQIFSPLARWPALLSCFSSPSFSASFLFRGYPEICQSASSLCLFSLWQTVFSAWMRLRRFRFPCLLYCVDSGKIAWLVFIYDFCSILMTMLLELWLLGTKPNRFVVLSVFIMIFGALIAAANDLAFDFISYAFIFGNNLSTACNGVYTKKFLNKKDLGKYGLLFYNALFGFPLVALLCHQIGQRFR